MSCLVFILTYIYIITKTDTLLTNQGALSAPVTESLDMDLDERNIEGRYNKISLMGFSSILRMQFSK